MSNKFDEGTQDLMYRLAAELIDYINNSIENDFDERCDLKDITYSLTLNIAKELIARTLSNKEIFKRDDITSRLQNFIDLKCNQLIEHEEKYSEDSPYKVAVTIDNI